jgi:hypothetical protein
MAVIFDMAGVFKGCHSERSEEPPHFARRVKVYEEGAPDTEAKSADALK